MILYLKLEAGKVCKIEYAISACWIFRKELLEKIGYLDETIFYSPEDAEYCARVWLNDLEVWYYPKVKIIHFGQRLSRKKFLNCFFLFIYLD